VARTKQKTAWRTFPTGFRSKREGGCVLKRYRRKNRSVSLLHAHLVFCSKFRRKVFTPAVFAALRASMEATARDLGVDIIAIEADRDHVHIMVAFPPNLALSDMVRRLKGASSRSIRAQRFPEVLRALWGKHFWSPSFFVVTCGGAPLEVVKRYVDTQNAPDRQPKRRTHTPRNVSDNNRITNKKQQNTNGPP
jgi:putative transposase